MSAIELSLKDVITRKPHRCIWCGERIHIGEKATRRTAIFDGFDCQYWHPECFDAMSKDAANYDPEEGFNPYEYQRGSHLLKGETE